MVINFSFALIQTLPRSANPCFGNESKLIPIKLRGKGDVIRFIKYDVRLIGDSNNVMARISSGLKELVEELGIEKGALLCFWKDVDDEGFYKFTHYNHELKLCSIIFVFKLIFV